MGALKGAPCTVKATEVTDTGLKVIFEWKDSNGTSHTTETIIPAGPQGEQGVPGAQGASGRGILTIEKTDTQGLVDTYTVTYDDGTYTTFQIKNGENGGLSTDGGTMTGPLILSGGDPIYVPVGSLIEYVTGGSGENDAIQINVDSKTHKVTASVKDGSLTKAMLAAGVQTSLGKADSAVQEIATGSANGNISVDGTDVPVKGLASGAFETVENLNATAQTKAEAEAGKIKTALLGTISDDASSETIRGAIAAAQKAGDDAAAAAQTAQETADAKVASVKATADLGIVVAGTATAPTIGVKVDPVAGNALSVSATGLKVTIPTADTYGLVKDEIAGDYAAVYHLTKNGANFGDAINIPKDMVVSSGTVETNPTGKPAGTYLVLVLANATSDKIYIPVDSLIEYVTSGSSATDMVVVDVSTDHKVTATITDGKITLAKLDSGVQASLGKADSALQAGDAPGYDDILTKTEAGTTYVAQEANKRLMTSTEGTKLEGIEAQATKNSIKLNGVANANPEFYAPTTAGSEGQVLMASGTGAPTWSAMPKSFIKFVQKNPALTPSGGKATWTIGASAHGIVAEDIMVQLFEVATGEQVFADVVVGADKSVKISMNASATVVANTYKAVLFG